MRNISFKSFFLICVLLGIFALFAGCGGGDSSVVPNSTGGDGLTNVPTDSPTSGTGTYSVSVSLPSSAALEEAELSANYIPPLSRIFRVTISGDGIDPNNSASFIQETDIIPGGQATITFTDLPVGLKTARLEILDEGGVLLAQRTHAFFLRPGGTENPGNIEMGVAIGDGGSCTPSNISVPVGTTLFYENQGTNTQTVSLANGQFSTGPIAGVQPSDGLADPAVYSTGSITFNTANGSPFAYDTGQGAPGQVSVVDTSGLAITQLDNQWNEPAKPST